MFSKKTFGRYSSNNINDEEFQRENISVSENLPAILSESVDNKNISRYNKNDIKGGFNAKKSSVKDTEILSYIKIELENSTYMLAKLELIEKLIDSIDFIALQKIPATSRKNKVKEVASQIINNIKIPVTAAQIALLKEQALDEVLGLGPIEPLLADSEVSDIMINSAKHIYVEKNGRIHLTDIKFLNETHLMGIIQRIVSRVGRRVDESSPMVDARLEDGSRFNALIPPIALDGALVSIRKFKKYKMPLSDYIDLGSMSPEMCHFLEICGKIRLNVIISGGTGSGKTTLLNALSGHIDISERVITIEDAAEIQMHQPHVLRLETRPPSTEGTGEITQRQLVKNALRMRPDRIILGEIRGNEVIDVLSAMNTGHDGSFATIHSNSPKDCLARIENLVGMSGVNVTTESLKYQIASAVNLIIQIARMRDGKRRITQIEAVTGIKDGEIETQTLFEYKINSIGAGGILEGNFINYGIMPELIINQARSFGLEDEILKCIE